MAGTLRELRQNLNLNQQAIATLVKSDIPQVSRWECGLAYPTLDEIIDMENFFKTRIQFNEGISAQHKFNAVQGIIDLAQKYPLPVIADWLYKTYKKEKNPEETIQTYAKICGSSFEPPMLPNV